MVSREQPVLFAVDLAGCTGMSALPPEAITSTFAQVLEGAGATIVQALSHHFPGGGGMTCVLILAESHAVLHTWPETGTAHVDIFSCSTRLKCRAAVDALVHAFGATSVSVQELSRVDGHRPPPDRRP